jgi:hypothetical protein
MLLALLGGVSHAQVARVCGVTLTTALAAGSLGSTIALWREKTFQTLAMTAVCLVVWLLAGEAVWRGALGAAWAGTPTTAWGEAISPFRAIAAAARPTNDATPLVAGADWLGDAVRTYMLGSGGAALLLNVVAVALVRVWNPTRETRPQVEQESEAADVGRSVHAAPGRTREVWDNPILWREICTWAYGRKVVVVRVAYAALFAASAWAMLDALRQTDGASSESSLAAAVQAVAPLAVLGLVLVNALAVTSLTNERDARALDLLLVTDLTPRRSSSASWAASSTTPRR